MRITSARATGLAPNEWVALQDTVKTELADLVSRLSKTANAQDHIKQELLYIARDDFEQRFKELPKGIDTATTRIMQRFSRIDEMIKTRKRQHPGSVMTLMPQMQKTQPQVGGGPSSGGPGMATGNMAEQPGQLGGGNNQNQTNPPNGNPNRTPGVAPNGNGQPGNQNQRPVQRAGGNQNAKGNTPSGNSGGNAPGNMNRNSLPSGGQSSPQAGQGIPGRPAGAKF